MLRLGDQGRELSQIYNEYSLFAQWMRMGLDCPGN